MNVKKLKNNIYITEILYFICIIAKATTEKKYS